MIRFIPDRAEIWPLESYKALHEGVWTLLRELEGLVRGRTGLARHRAFANFDILARSHFDYEERWIFPLIGAALREGLREPPALRDDDRMQAAA